MAWWADVLFLIVVVLAVWGFASIVGFRTGMLTRKTQRTAENLYPRFADSERKQQAYAAKRGGEWRNEEH